MASSSSMCKGWAALFYCDYPCAFQKIIGSPEPKTRRCAYRIGVEQASVRTSIRPSILSNINISKTSGPIVTKFYQNHNWGGGKATLGFGPKRIRTLVSMTTDTPKGS